MTPAKAELTHLARDATTVCIFVRVKKGKGGKSEASEGTSLIRALHHSVTLLFENPGNRLIAEAEEGCSTCSPEESALLQCFYLISFVAA